MQKIIVANWKQHPALVAEAMLLAKATDYENFVVCPPHQFLESLKGVLQSAKLGAQDYAPDLAMRGVSHVIIGHFDRRKGGETNDIIAEKVALAVNEGLIPILCVGETKEERDRGKKESVIREQLRSAFSHPNLSKSDFDRVFIAYEPVWAISTEVGSAPDTPENAISSIAFMKEQLLHLNFEIPEIRYLYGGSVSSSNIQTFIQREAINGAFVGAASLNPEEIKTIWQTIQTIQNA